MSEAPVTRCGFIAILGAPNVGKSTLINRFVGSKVSIVSPKVQTTRTRVLGIVIQGKAQIVFIDATRGIDEDGRRILDRLKEQRRPALVAINKVDLVAKPPLLALAAQLAAEGLFESIHMISAETGDGVDDLQAELSARVAPGPW